MGRNEAGAESWKKKRSSLEIRDWNGVLERWHGISLIGDLGFYTEEERGEKREESCPNIFFILFYFILLFLYSIKRI